MSRLDEFLSYIREEQGRVSREEVIRNGRRVMLKKKSYNRKCPDGYKHDNDGNIVRMSAEERRNRSIAAKKAANKSSTKRNKAISMRRRDSLIQD